MYVAFGAREPRRELGTSPTGGSGDALLSRFRFVSTAWAPLPPIPGKKQRGFLEARLAPDAGPTCTVVSLHLDHTDERTRQRQFSDVLAWYLDNVLGVLRVAHEAVGRIVQPVLVAAHELTEGAGIALQTLTDEPVFEHAIGRHREDSPRRGA